MVKAAVILSGCGFMDGAEIRESVLALLALSRAGAEVQIFAPDIVQHRVVNHLTGKEVKESRNVLVESARIARGNIQDLSHLKVKDFDALILPGGFGVATNLSDLAFKGAEATVLPAFKAVLLEFLKQRKPIGAICIAPAVLVAAVGDEYAPTVTIGEDKGTAQVIEALGGMHKNCATDACIYDPKNRIASCSAYMRDGEPLAKIAEGIEQCVNKTLQAAREQAKAA